MERVISRDEAVELHAGFVEEMESLFGTGIEWRLVYEHRSSPARLVADSLEEGVDPESLPSVEVELVEHGPHPASELEGTSPVERFLPSGADWLSRLFNLYASNYRNLPLTDAVELLRDLYDRVVFPEGASPRRESILFILSALDYLVPLLRGRSDLRSILQDHEAEVMRKLQEDGQPEQPGWSSIGPAIELMALGPLGCRWLCELAVLMSEEGDPDCPPRSLAALDRGTPYPHLLGYLVVGLSRLFRGEEAPVLRVAQDQVAEALGIESEIWSTLEDELDLPSQVPSNFAELLDDLDNPQNDERILAEAIISREIYDNLMASHPHSDRPSSGGEVPSALGHIINPGQVVRHLIGSSGVSGEIHFQSPPPADRPDVVFSRDPVSELTNRVRGFQQVPRATRRYREIVPQRSVTIQGRNLSDWDWQ